MVFLLLFFDLFLILLILLNLNLVLYGNWLIIYGKNSKMPDISKYKSVGMRIESYEKLKNINTNQENNFSQHEINQQLILKHETNIIGIEDKITVAFQIEKIIS